jgi:hypothetical protein
MPRVPPEASSPRKLNLAVAEAQTQVELLNLALHQLANSNVRPV